MQVLVRLYDMVNPAADGSTISREVTEKYLASEDYKTIIKDRLALGGKTHKDRQLNPEDSLVGPDDEVLIRKNSLFYISEIFTKPDSDYCWAIITIFDPDNFSGELRDEIINLQGLLKEGTKLPCSVVIQALWGSDNSCQEIIRIKGVDFTLNPSFAGSGTEKLMSVTSLSNPEQVKTFSEVEVSKQTKLFSFISNLEQVDTEVYSKSDILSIFGRNSGEYKAFTILSNGGTSTVSKKEIADWLINHDKGADYLSFEDFQDFLKEYITPENIELFQSIFRENISGIERVVHSVPKTDPYYRETVTREIVDFLVSLPIKREGLSVFSLASMVEDKMSLSLMSPVLRFRYLIRLYSKYAKVNSLSITKSEILLVEQLFISDIVDVLKTILPEVMDGSNISSILQLASYDADLSNIAMRLSYYYRRVLIADDTVGYVPKSTYVAWSSSIEQFYSKLLSIVFGENANRVKLSFSQFRL